jgi:Xaa-Pro dipeptidase
MAPKAKHGASDFARVALPKQFCNLDRLLFALERRGLDGIVATLPYNAFYLSGFNGVAHKADEPRPYALVLSRHAPQQPILVVADYYLAIFLVQPTWVADIRPFRAVMMPLDLPPNKTDIDRFIPPAKADIEWLGRAQRNYAAMSASGTDAEVPIRVGQVRLFGQDRKTYAQCEFFAL